MPSLQVQIIVSRVQMEPMKVIRIAGKKLRLSLELRTRASDDRGHTDLAGEKCPTRDIPQQRELIDRNLMKLPGCGHFACCWTWKTWGNGGMRLAGRDLQQTQFLCGFTIKLLFFLVKARKIWYFLLKHRDLNAIGSASNCYTFCKFLWIFCCELIRPLLRIFLRLLR
jgi:hypothetical protein